MRESQERQEEPPFFDEDAQAAPPPANGRHGPTAAEMRTEAIIRGPQRTQALAAQQALVGGLLLGGAWSAVADLVCIEDYAPEHRLILAAIEQLARDARPHDPVTVSQQLEIRGHLLVAGGLAYLSELFRNTPTAANVRDYARMVRKAALAQRLPENAAAIARDHSERESLDRPDAATRSLAGVSFSDMQPHLADSYLVKQLLMPHTLVGMIGASGSGKTFFATDLALHIAAGRSWRDARVRGGPVVYGALEGPASAENRFVAARKDGGYGAGIPLRLTAGPINLRDPAHVGRLIEFIRDTQSLYGQPCAAVFVDTLSRAMSGGEENGSEDMGKLIAGADAVRLTTGATVILVHHLG
jgi:hypothetical protein